MGWGVEDAAIYSTCFWHLQMPYELGKLSMDTEDFEFRSPETCCVVGNKFSRAGEHLLAVKYFKRAIFIDRRFTYAYTLAGHELLELGQAVEAGEYFQKAIANDPRHQNAW
jgi:anaphase-promoting complex subunit 3